MRVVDEARLEMPYAGARKVRAALRRRTGGEVDVSRRCVASLMEEMNVRPARLKSNLSKPNLSKPNLSKPGQEGVQASPPAEKQAHKLPQPGVGQRHHLHPDREGAHVPVLMFTKKWSE